MSEAGPAVPSGRGMAKIWRDRWNVLSIAITAAALMPMIVLPLFWLFDWVAHIALGIRPNSGDFTAPFYEVAQAMFFGFSPASFVTGLLIGTQRALSGHISLLVAAVAGLIVGAINLFVFMQLMPDTEPPELPFRLQEISVIAAFVVPSALLAALIRAIDRSRFSRPGI